MVIACYVVKNVHAIKEFWFMLRVPFEDQDLCLQFFRRTVAAVPVFTNTALSQAPTREPCIARESMRV
jgi:hypothetical protein